MHADPEVGGGGGGGGGKLCETQPGLKLDLLWSDSLRKFSQRSDCFSAKIQTLIFHVGHFKNMKTIKTKTQLMLS